MRRKRIVQERRTFCCITTEDGFMVGERWGMGKAKSKFDPQPECKRKKLIIDVIRLEEGDWRKFEG
jgi:hypothetical protein